MSAVVPRHIALWDEWNAGGGPAYPHAKVIQFCFRNYPAVTRGAMRALDLGCGSGVNTRFLAQEGFDTSATDISPTGVCNTRELLRQHALVARCEVAPLERQPFDPETFDLVISVGVFDSAGPDAAAAGMNELLRVLKPGGRALLVFASDRDMRAGDGTRYGLHAFSDGEVRAMLPDGLQESAIDRYITTYGGGQSEHNDFLVTLRK